MTTEGQVSTWQQAPLLTTGGSCSSSSSFTGSLTSLLFCLFCFLYSSLLLCLSLYFLCPGSAHVKAVRMYSHSFVLNWTLILGHPHTRLNDLYMKENSNIIIWLLNPSLSLSLQYKTHSGVYANHCCLWKWLETY